MHQEVDIANKAIFVEIRLADCAKELPSDIFKLAKMADYSLWKLASSLPSIAADPIEFRNREVRRWRASTRLPFGISPV